MFMKTKAYSKLILKPYKIILKHFNNKNMKVEIGRTFCCYPQLKEKIICIPILERVTGSDAFYDKMKKRLKKSKIEGEFSNEILSFLHEIGHIYTYKKINEITYVLGATLIKKIQAKFTNPKYLNFFYNCYFNLKLEKLADKWAINFIKENQELVEDWQDMIQINYNKVLPKFVEHIKYKYKIDLLA